MGKSGTGKSEIIKAIAGELGLPIVDLRLSQLPPEDLNGLPAPTDDKKAFTYLLPDWYNKFQPDTPFVLFLDEINQATPNTINALYAIVHDRMIAGCYNPIQRRDIMQHALCFFIVFVLGCQVLNHSGFCRLMFFHYKTIQ